MTSSASPSNGAVPVRVSGVLSRQVGDDVVAIHPGTQQAHALSGDAALVWHSLETNAAAPIAQTSISHGARDAAVAQLLALDLVRLDEPRGVSRRSILARSGLVAAGVGIVTIALPEAVAAASTTVSNRVGPGSGTLVIPAGAHDISIQFTGGTGALAKDNSGGAGAAGRINWTPGITLTGPLTIAYVIGAAGAGATGGAGAGKGGDGNGNASNRGGGGGGSSSLSLTGSVSGTLIAGGGGGAGDGRPGIPAGDGGSVNGLGGGGDGTAGTGAGGAGGAAGGAGTPGGDAVGTGGQGGGGGGAGGNGGSGGSADAGSSATGGGGGAGSSAILNFSGGGAKKPAYGASVGGVLDGFLAYSYIAG